MPATDPPPRDSSSTEPADEDRATLRRRVADLEDELLTLRRTLAARRSNTESTYRSVFDAVNDGIFVHDLELGVIIDMNRPAENMTGFGRDELLGKTLAVLGASDGPSPFSVEGARWRWASGGEEQRLEWACQPKEGPPFVAEVTLKRVRMAGRDRLLAIAMDISERKERARLQEELIEAQAASLAELAAPVIPISDRVVVMPMIGMMDTRRVAQAQEALLSGVVERRANVAILDITGVPRLDAEVADGLMRVARAVKLLGARFLLTGVRPVIARTLVELGVNLGDVATHSTLQAGIAAALRADGLM